MASLPSLPDPEKPEKKSSPGLPDVGSAKPRRGLPKRPSGGLPDVSKNAESSKSSLPSLPDPEPAEVEEEDDSFESLNFSEVEEYDDKESSEKQESAEQPKKTKPAVPPRQRRQLPVEDDGKSLPSGTKNEKRPEAFIDKKRVKILPFGRKQKNKDGTVRKQLTSEFDGRNNLRKKNKLITTTVLVLTGVLVASSVIQTVVPDNNLEEEDVQEIVAQMTGSSFPLDRGEALAESFIDAYTSRSGDNIDESILAFFYSGEAGARTHSSEPTFESSGDFSQSVVKPAKVVDKRVGNPFSASFTVMVGVSVSDDPDGIPRTTPDGDPNVELRFFDVNVFHDPNTDAMSIAPGSPSIVPPINIADSNTVPNEQAIGLGEDNAELNAETRGTVEGFINAFMEVTPESSSAVSQYIVADPPLSVINGFGGEFEIDGDPQDAILTEAFFRGEHGGDEAIVRTTVKMRDKSTQYEESSNEDTRESYATYTSTYMVFLSREGERWVVTDMESYVHVADPAEVLGE